MRENLLYQDKNEKVKTKTYIRLETCIPVVKAYHNVAFVLAIICCREENAEWFFSNFINLYSNLDSNNNLSVNYDVQFFIDEIYYLNRESMSMKNLDLFQIDIVKFFENMLLNNRYICVYLDEYYIEFTMNYKLNHYEHEVLVVGIDIENKWFEVLCYGKDLKLDYRKITFEVFKMAYYSEYIHRDTPVMFFSYHSKLYREKYKIDKAHIFSMIKYYLSSYNFFNIRRGILYRKEDVNNKYGIEIYSDFEIYLSNIAEGHKNGKIQKIELLPFYVLFEHKENMERRIYFLYKMGYIEEKYIVEYEEIVKEARIILNLTIKYNMQVEKNAYCDKYLRNLIKMIEDIRKKEVNILKKMSET